ncbi:hypothetical protein CLU79DRAFT_721960 [Phycomyces nitens]|nr:hypothetical protein CLU79DRAFT_721960 [Phycomyces nitens]
MPNSELPFEILIYIASFLSTNDRLSCITTCKTWEPAFQETLWNTVDIRHKGKLNAIHNLLVSKGDSIYSQGKHVRKLVFAVGLKVNSDQLCSFQKHCQKIQHLVIREGGLSKDYFLKRPDWKLWGSLTSLEICLSGLNLVNEPKELNYILSHLPRLRRLDYVDAMMGPRPVYKLDDFETLHAHLPQLEHLSMAVWLDSIPTKDLSLIQATPPAASLTTMKLYVDNMDIWWTYYMAQKYPNISTLEMKIDTEFRRPNDFRQSATLELFNISRAFPCLENTVITCRPNTEWSQLTLWNLLCRFDTPQRHLKYDLHSCYDMSGSLERTVSASIQSCTKTLESFHISSYIDFSDLCKVSKVLGFCPNLVDLQITSYITVVGLDVFLDHCLVLKSLTLGVSMLSGCGITAPILVKENKGRL